jgi:hypothetical protein
MVQERKCRHGQFTSSCDFCRVERGRRAANWEPQITSRVRPPKRDYTGIPNNPQSSDNPAENSIGRKQLLHDSSPDPPHLEGGKCELHKLFEESSKPLKKIWWQLWKSSLLRIFKSMTSPKILNSCRSLFYLDC